VRRHIVLVGLMAAGKTTVGRLLAEALGRPFSDSDESIERERGRTVSALADEIGVDEMHELEAAHLLKALAESEPNVVAAAASTIDDPACRRALAASDVTVIWLEADPEALAERFDDERHRPRFGRPPVELLTQQAEERAPLFRALDPIAIEADGRTPEEVVAIALAELANRR
jgi:shikimate kinase